MPQPGPSWEPECEPARQPHEHLRDGTAKVLTLFHPAAALYTPSNLEMLRADFQRIPALLALGPPEQPEPFRQLEPPEAVEDLLEADSIEDVEGRVLEPTVQLGLF